MDPCAARVPEGDAMSDSVLKEVALVGAAVVLLGGGALVGGLGGGDRGEGVLDVPGDVQPVAERVDVRVAVLGRACAGSYEEPREVCGIFAGVWLADKGEQLPDAWRESNRPEGCTRRGRPEEREPDVVCLDDRSEVCASERWRAWSANEQAVDAQAAKCPGGVQLLGERRCLCYADVRAESIEGEALYSADLDPRDRVRLVVCCDRERAVVLRLPAALPLGKDCRTIGEPVSDFVAGDMDTDFARMMSAACAPCAGPGGADCPACLCAPGGCAEACK